MLFELLTGGFTKDALVSVLLSVPVILFALTIHECSHGYAAKLMGDPTAYNMGRLTLNPAKHLDPMGTLMMLLFGFGWAKPVPINTRYFKNPKKGMLLSALAGPMSNIIAAYIFYLISFLIYKFSFLNTFLPFGSYISSKLVWMSTSDYILMTVYLLFYVAYIMNVGLAIFNLLPIPPLDGSRIFLGLLPAKYYFSIMKYERYIYIAVLVLMFTGVLSVPLSYIRNGIDWLFSLSVSWMV